MSCSSNEEKDRLQRRFVGQVLEGGEKQDF
jgi:hypothetical protein